MPSFFTPARIAVVVLILLGLVLAGTAAWYGDRAQRQSNRAVGAELEAAAMGLAVAVETSSGARAALTSVVERLDLDAAYALGRDVGMVAQQTASRLDGVDGATVFGPPDGATVDGPARRVTWQGEAFWTASSASPDGRRVILVRGAGPRASLLGAFGVAGALWLLIAGATVVLLRSARVPVRAMEALARELHRSDPASTEGVLEHLEQKKAELYPLLGEAVVPLLELGHDVGTARRDLGDARALLNAFMQVGPHYVLLCTLDGQIVDANPAFFARTNLMPEWLRGQPTGVLEEILPMDALLDLGARSKRENTAISGVPYGLRVDDTQRAVTVALRTVTTAEGDLVLIVINDQTRERTLEHQIDQYTDALDLMVDQRVAELTAGRDDLAALLDAAGVAVATFDRDGMTKRFNRGAEQLTGRTAFTVRRFTDLAAALCVDASDGEALNAWFWSSSERPFSMRVRTPRGERAMVWRCGQQLQAGEATERVLLGVEVPSASAQPSLESGLAFDSDAAPVGRVGVSGDGAAFTSENEPP